MSGALAFRPHDDPDQDARDDSGNSDDEEEEEDVNEAGYKTVKDAVLFAIEVSKSMLAVPPPSEAKRADRQSAVLAALTSAYQLIQQRIISQPKDMMGILLYGTQASKFYDEGEKGRGNLSYPGCYLLADLDVPEAETVRALKGLVQDDSSEAREILKPSTTPVTMSNVLFCANQIFTTKAPNFSSRRLFIVTDNDHPHASEKALRSAAAVRAKDLYDLGVVLELFPISSPTHTFDRKLFYDDIIYRSTPRDPHAPTYNPSALSSTDLTDFTVGPQDGITLLQSLLSSIASKQTPHRALFSSVPLELAPGFRISVKGYLLYKHQKPARTSYIFLGSERPQIAVGSTTQHADDTARPLEKTEIRKAYAFGGEQVVFTPEEIKELRHFGEPVIRLVGFKPRSMLPMWANTKQSTFIYPSEEHFVGSTRVFSALHHKLVKSDLMALTWFIARRNAAPVIAALLPTLTAPDDPSKPNLAGVSRTGCPQGLHLIPLPFADDIRQNPPMPHGDDPLRAPDSLVNMMRDIVRQLSLPKGIYDPSKYPNPALQWHYRILQALALEEDLPEQPDDKTKPKYRQIDRRVGAEVTAWGVELEKVFEKHQKQGPGSAGAALKKRSATGESATPGPSKRVKAEAGDTVGEAEMRKLWERQQVGKLTVQQLKDWCGVKSLPLDGKKADLVERIESWFETR